MRKKIAIIITKLELGGAQQTALHLAGNLDRENLDIRKTWKENLDIHCLFSLFHFYSYMISEGNLDIHYLFSFLSLPHFGF